MKRDTIRISPQVINNFSPKIEEKARGVAGTVLALAITPC
jgi:hypothetical protein